MKQGKVHIGTSGWFYEHWIGPFYPESLSRKKFLPYYMQHLDSVEINRTFYSLPKKKVFEEYAGLAARPFIFSVKASQFITHMKRLSNPRQPLRKLLGRLEGLGKHWVRSSFSCRQTGRSIWSAWKSFSRLCQKGIGMHLNSAIRAGSMMRSSHC